MLKAKEYAIVAKLLEVIKEHEFLYSDSYYFRLNFKYLENMYLFLVTGDLKKMELVTSFIKILEDLGETKNAELIRKEVQDLLGEHDIDGLSEHDIIIAKL